MRSWNRCQCYHYYEISDSRSYRELLNCSQLSECSLVGCPFDDDAALLYLEIHGTTGVVHDGLNNRISKDLGDIGLSETREPGFSRVVRSLLDFDIDKVSITGLAVLGFIFEVLFDIHEGEFCTRFHVSVDHWMDMSHALKSFLARINGAQWNTFYRSSHVLLHVNLAQLGKENVGIFAQFSWTLNFKDLSAGECLSCVVRKMRRTNMLAGKVSTPHGGVVDILTK